MRLVVDLRLVQFQPETLRIAAEIEDTIYGCDVPGYLVVDGVGETLAQEAVVAEDTRVNSGVQYEGIDIREERVQKVVTDSFTQ
jgi:hypothetical protein